MVDANKLNNFDFELVSPEKKLMSKKAWQVTIPGAEGDFGVRAGHSSLVSAIRTGVVEIISEEGATPTQIFIAGGFADVTATNCTVLAEEAIMLSDMNHGEIEKEIFGLEEQMTQSQDDIEKARLTKQVAVAQAKLSAIAIAA